MNPVSCRWPRGAGLAGRDRGARLRKGGEPVRRFGDDGKHRPFRAYWRML